MNWLTKLRKEKKISQRRLSELSGVNIYTIQSIEQGTRNGSPETIEKLMKYFNSGKPYYISFDSDELITKLEEDMSEFGEEHVFYAMFELIDKSLFLTNYDFIESEETQSTQKDSQYDFIVEMKARDIMKFLKIQNKCFKS